MNPVVGQLPAPAIARVLDSRPLGLGCSVPAPAHRAPTEYSSH
jgi:hypothetical protein